MYVVLYFCILYLNIYICVIFANVATNIIGLVYKFFWQTSNTSIRLNDQSFYTFVNVSVSPHTLWVRSDASQTERSTFHSIPASKYVD